MEIQPPPALLPESATTGLIDGIKASRISGGEKNQDALDLFKKTQEQPVLKKALQIEVYQRICAQDPKFHPPTPESIADLRFCLQLAEELGINNIKEADAYLRAVCSRLPKQKQDKTISRRQLIGGLGASLVGLPMTLHAVTTFGNKSESNPAANTAAQPKITETTIPPKPTNTAFIKPTLEPNPTTKPVSPTQTATTEASPTTPPSPTKPPEATSTPEKPIDSKLSPATPIPTAEVMTEKSKKILYPKELLYNEVKEWIGKMRNSHDAVLTESMFTAELATLSKQKRHEVLKAIASAHAEALVKHYKETDAIIGLDPGHGGSDTGSSAKTIDGDFILEKDLAFDLANLTAEEIYKRSRGKYTIVMLRPEKPNDEDLDSDGITSPVERIQKRKALLLAMEKKLRPDEKQRGKNILYLSLHFNGSVDPTQKGIETYWPNQTAVSSEQHRNSSQQLAKSAYTLIRDSIRASGYPISDRGAKQDPDTRQPLSNSDQTHGPYNVLGSPKLDRILRS